MLNKIGFININTNSLKSGSFVSQKQLSNINLKDLNQDTFISFGAEKKDTYDSDISHNIWEDVSLQLYKKEITQSEAYDLIIKKIKDEVKSKKRIEINEDDSLFAQYLSHIMIGQARYNNLYLKIINKSNDIYINKLNKQIKSGEKLNPEYIKSITYNNSEIERSCDYAVRSKDFIQDMRVIADTSINEYKPEEIESFKPAKDAYEITAKLFKAEFNQEISSKKDIDFKVVVAISKANLGLFKHTNDEKYILENLDVINQCIEFYNKKTITGQSYPQAYSSVVGFRTILSERNTNFEKIAEILDIKFMEQNQSYDWKKIYKSENMKVWYELAKIKDEFIEELRKITKLENSRFIPTTLDSVTSELLRQEEYPKTFDVTVFLDKRDDILNKYLIKKS